MSRILVTGGAGFIGSHLVDALIAGGHEVHALDNLSGGFVENVHPQARFWNVDITNHDAIDGVFAAVRPEYVYHLAAYAAEGLSHFIRRFNYTNNLIGSVNLINASIRNKVKLFVFASSAAVYGPCGSDSQASEDRYLNPIDPYGVAKMAVEHDLRVAKYTHDLSYVIFRMHNVFGPRQNIGDKYRNVVGIWMNQILKGEPQTIYGDGTQRRQFTDVANITPYFTLAPRMSYESLNTAYNIGANDAMTINEMAEAVAYAMYVPEWPVVHLPPRHEAHTVRLDHTRANETFGRIWRRPFAQALREMAEWVDQHGARETPKFADIELEEGLPEVWR